MEKDDDQVEFQPSADALPPPPKDDVPLSAMQTPVDEDGLRADAPFQNEMRYSHDPVLVAKAQEVWKAKWGGPRGEARAKARDRLLLALRLKVFPAWAVSDGDRQAATQETARKIQEKAKGGNVDADTALQFAMATDDSLPVATAAMAPFGLNLALEAKDWVVGLVNEHNPSANLFIGTFLIPEWAYTGLMDVKKSSIKYARYAHPWAFLRPGQLLSLLMWPADVRGAHAKGTSAPTKQFYSEQNGTRRGFTVALNEVGMGANTREEIVAATAELKRARVGYDAVVGPAVDDEARRKLLDRFVVHRHIEEAPHLGGGTNSKVKTTTLYLADRQTRVAGSALDYHPMVCQTFAEVGILNVDILVDTVEKPYMGSNKRIAAIQVLARADALNAAYQTDVFTSAN